METILLSVKPEYAENILEGIKKYEYRRRLAKKSVDKIVIYETEPQMQIVGEVQVLGTISSSPTSLWEQTKQKAGICRSKYRDYFRGCNLAHAYCLGEVIKYAEPKLLSDFGISQAPQSFVYIKTLPKRG